MGTKVISVDFREYSEGVNKRCAKGERRIFGRRSLIAEENLARPFPARIVESRRSPASSQVHSGLVITPSRVRVDQFQRLCLADVHGCGQPDGEQGRKDCFERIDSHTHMFPSHDSNHVSLLNFGEWFTVAFSVPRLAGIYWSLNH